MNKNNKPTPPDFLVRWNNASNSYTESINCDLPSPASGHRSGGKLRNALATLQVGPTYIEVSELTWSEPTTLTFMPNRVGFCFLITYSTSIEYGYTPEAEPVKSGGLGRTLFMLPGREICGHISTGTIRTVTCTFDCDYAESIVGPLARLSQSQLLDSLDVRNSLISSIMLRLSNETLYPGPLSNAVVESYGCALLVECAHWLLTGELKIDSPGRLTARHFGIIENYLSGVSGHLPSVSELAAACGFSERYFSKLFREQTSFSVAQYIKSVQITKAKSYLLETSIPLKEIAHRLGFSTSSNFSAAFRAATGCAPGEFRKAD